MGKVLFATYLTVEEKIITGDYFLNADNGTIQEFTKEDAQDQDNAHKKVTLFLCEKNTEPDGTITSDTIITIIGAISKAATWVQDGMEFDEDNLRIIYADYLLPLNQFPPLIKRKVIAVKCPTCGGFH